MKIPLIDVSKQNKALAAEIEQAIKAVIESSAFILGPEVTQFEQEFRAYTGVEQAISCASGTDALLLPLMAAGVGPGDEVLVPSFTFYATAGSVSRLGARPIFVDSDDSYNICLKDLEKKISPRTKAIIPVHLFGQMVDMPALLEIVKRHEKCGKKIVVVEDCAQAIGAAFNGQQSGTWGDCGAYSFYPTKNLGAMGDAGMMSAKANSDVETLRMLRVHGSKQRYYHEIIGVNSRLDSFQAAILRVKLRHLKSYEEKRKSNGELYLRLFSQANLVDRVTMPVTFSERKHVWNQFTVRVKERDRLKSFLAEKGIGSDIYYPLAMHQQKAFQCSGEKAVVLTVCETLQSEVLSLPMFPELESSQIERVVGAVSDFYK